MVQSSKMASTSVAKSVTFAAEKEVIIEATEHSSDSSDESDAADYVESLSEGEAWSSSDEEQAEFFECLLEGSLQAPSRSSLDPAERKSLLFLDKDILKHEEEGKLQ